MRFETGRAGTHRLDNALTLWAGRTECWMVRLLAVALIVLAVPTHAWADPPVHARQQPQSIYLPPSAAGSAFNRSERLGRTEIAPNLHFGVGVFGLKSDKSPLRPVTAREIDVPKQRRAAVGFSLKF